ncbi:MAG TPA: GNAT family protein [Patescibacteria group bacterium]|nr:GNAT family protein [Patescibacteria group bacterium]
MSKFIPGKIVKEFVTKSGRPAMIRYPKWEDVNDLLAHINSVSSENVFITFSGEQQSLEQESLYLSSEFTAMEVGRAVKLFCYVDGKFAGVCDIHRDISKKERTKHVGIFGLVISRGFRGDGIGFELAAATISEAKKQMAGLRLILLDCFAQNTPAISLYSKLGFSETGRVPKALLYKGAYDDEVHMALEIGV